MFSGVWRFQYYFSSYVSSHFQQSMADLPPGKPQISEKGGVSSLGNSPGTDSPIKEPKPWMNLHLPAQLQWIPRNWTWSNLKPVIRCSIVAWVSAVLFIIPRVELLMGQVCFLVLMCTLSWSISQGKFSNSYWWELLICLCDPFHWSRCFSGLFISTQRSIRWCPGTRISNSVVRGVIMVVSGHITCIVSLHLSDPDGHPWACSWQISPERIWIAQSHSSKRCLGNTYRQRWEHGI